MIFVTALSILVPFGSAALAAANLNFAVQALLLGGGKPQYVGRCFALALFFSLVTIFSLRHIG